jgi:hypothetical protein
MYLYVFPPCVLQTPPVITWLGHPSTLQYLIILILVFFVALVDLIPQVLSTLGMETIVPMLSCTRSFLRGQRGQAAGVVLPSSVFLRASFPTVEDVGAPHVIAINDAVGTIVLVSSSCLGNMRYETYRGCLRNMRHILGFGVFRRRWEIDDWDTKPTVVRYVWVQDVNRCFKAREFRRNMTHNITMTAMGPWSLCREPLTHSSTEMKSDLHHGQINLIWHINLNSLHPHCHHHHERNR